MKKFMLFLSIFGLVCGVPAHGEINGGGENMGDQFEDSVDDMDSQNEFFLGELLPVKVIVKLASSSTLKPQGANKYSVKNLLDLDFSTCWAEGVKGTGVGEWIEFSFAEGVTIDKIAFANGYLKSQKTLDQNSSPKEIRIVVYFDQEVWEMKVLLDKKKFAQVSAETDDEIVELTTVIDLETAVSIDGHKLPGQPVVKIRFYIESVYPGTKYDDTCISDILLYGFADGYIN